MPTEEQDNSDRIQAIVAALITKRIGESLGQVERALAAWRRGESDVIAAHSETLRHVERAGALSARVAGIEADGPATMLRDALDAELLTRDEFVALAGKLPEEVTPPPPLDEEAGARIHRADKRTVLSTMLQQGAVLLHLDARCDGVDVPPGLRDNPRLVLRLGYALTPPITDLESGTEGIRATLAFGGVPHLCVVPWSAVWAIVADDGQGVVFPEDMPAEIRDELRQPSPGAPEPVTPSGKRRGGHLKLV